MSEFFSRQSEKEKQEYIRFLERFGELSRLFSDNDAPYLHYRIHENLFCKVFDADNLSRGDISYDAKSGSVGIGLKTFLHGNGQTYQKVAEFNKDSELFRNAKSSQEIIEIVSKLRNDRLDFAKNSTDCDKQLYHLITRANGKMMVFECEMSYIDVENIKILPNNNKNTILFTDGKNDYSFSQSKSTLLQKFNTVEPIVEIPVNISDDPFSIIIGLQEKSSIEGSVKISETASSEKFIYLPLYSPKENEVSERSGLNQWNANGRKRHHDEVYISVPAEIYRFFPDFFPYNPSRDGNSPKNSSSFDVRLPNGEILSCKIAQQGGKAFMSNPNKALGKWILRKVLNIAPKTLLKKDDLDRVGIDSVKLTKISHLQYRLDFSATGSYSEFMNELRDNQQN